MARDTYRYFRIEARDLLEQLGRGALELERGALASAAVPGLLRLAHTLKGAARVVHQREIADAVHAIEDLLAPWRSEAVAIPHERLQHIASHLASIGEQLAAIRLPVALESSAEPVPSSAEDAVRLVRADVTDIDDIVGGVASTQVQLSTVRRTLVDAVRARRLAELLELQLGPGAGLERPADRARAAAIAGDLRSVTALLERRLASGLEQAGRELGQVREAVERLRLIGAGSVLDALERTARDAGRSLGKRVLFERHGGEMRMDARVLTIAQDALVQLVRNAVAHGIEPESERRAAGKPESGRISVSISRRGRLAIFSCVDDGRGVDLEAVTRAARERGVLPTDPAAMRGASLGPGDLLALLLRGGISTSASVTELSGRGVGLDVVRHAAVELGGDVRVDTGVGRGTRIELSVPLDVSAFDALLVRSDDRIVAIPIDAVRRTLRIGATDLLQGSLVLDDGESLAFATLSRCMGSPDQNDRARSGSAVVVESAGQRSAVGVDKLIGLAHLVVRPLPELAPADPIVAGAAQNEHGHPILLLDPTELVARARVPRASRAPDPPAAAPLLVIDDSLTTRMLEQSILESAGFVVDVASSAEEGLEAARRKAYGCFLVDVEMPGMDGFEFIAKTRLDPLLREVPAILVTSRASAEDRAHGERVGARGYMVKSDFDQGVLLARIRELVGRT